MTNYEWGIIRRGSFRHGTVEMHRCHMTEDEARTWLKEFIEDGGHPKAFYVARRPVADWEVIYND